MAINPNLPIFLSRLRSVTTCPNGWEACCPAHDDTRPSLSISESDDGKILLTCQSNGCHPGNIMQCAGMSSEDMFPPKSEHGKSEWGELVKSYSYTDEAGIEIFQVCRFEKTETLPSAAGQTSRIVKTFRQRHRVDGKWVWKMTGVRRVLYHWPQLLARPADPVFVVEGEKQVEFLESLGLVATCNPQGAGKWQDDFSEALRARDVVVVPDNDPVTNKKGVASCVGMEHAETVADSLTGKAASVHVLTLPDAGEKWGLDDWLQKGDHDLEELAELLAVATPWVYGSKLFERTTATTAATKAADDPDADPYADHRAVAEAIQIDVLGETETGQVMLYSRHHRKTINLSPMDIGKLQLPRLVQFAGPPAERRCYVGKDACPDGCVSINDVRMAISALAGRRQIENSLRGGGIWQCDGDLVLVGRGEVVAVNGHLERAESAEIKGHVFDLSAVPRPWFNFEAMSAAWEASADPEWCRAAVAQADKLFDMWSFDSPGTHRLLTGLTLATWIQTAWQWRPQTFVLGGSNVGKSALFQMMTGDESSGTAGIFNRLGVSFSNFSAAGISQSIGHSAPIVFLDEFEQSKQRAEVLEMIRGAGRGSELVRGTAGHKSKKFRLHQMFWMGSTESGLTKEVDQNRVILIEMNRTSDEKKWRAFKVPPDAELQSLGLKLLVCILRHARRAVTLASTLYRAKPPAINDRVCESYAVPAAAIAAATGLTDEEAFAVYVDLLRIAQPEQVEPAAEQLLVDILNSLVDCGRGVKKTASEIVAGRLPGGEYVSTEIETALESCGVKVCREDDKDDGSPWGVFIAPKLATRLILRDTNWKGVKIGEHLSRLRGSIKCKKRINGVRPWGHWVPVSSIELFSSQD